MEDELTEKFLAIDKTLANCDKRITKLEAKTESLISKLDKWNGTIKPVNTLD